MCQDMDLSATHVPSPTARICQKICGTPYSLVIYKPVGTETREWILLQTNSRVEHRSAGWKITHQAAKISLLGYLAPIVSSFFNDVIVMYCIYRIWLPRSLKITLFDWFGWSWHGSWWFINNINIIWSSWYEAMTKICSFLDFTYWPAPDSTLASLGRNMWAIGASSS